MPLDNNLLPQLRLASVGAVSEGGVTLVFPEDGVASQKVYQVVEGLTLEAGNRVLAAKLSGTYVVLARIAGSVTPPEPPVQITIRQEGAVLIISGVPDKNIITQDGSALAIT